MKKRYIVSALGLGVAGYLMGKRSSTINSFESRHIHEDSTFINAGIPDEVDDLELDQLENAKMVSEGSQFGVQYYNEMKENE